MRLSLIVDTREQMPLKFKEGFFDEIRSEARPFADYWAEVDGKEVPLMFERKGQGDLFQTMTHGYKRFKRMLEKAEAVDSKVVLLIEGSMRDIAAGYPYSDFNGTSMLRKLAMLHVRYDLEYHFFNDRREMARFIEEEFDAIRRNFKK